MWLNGVVDFCYDGRRQMEVECLHDDAVLSSGEVDEVHMHC